MTRIRKILGLVIVTLFLAFSVSTVFADDNGAGDHETGDLNSTD